MHEAEVGGPGDIEEFKVVERPMGAVIYFRSSLYLRQRKKKALKSSLNTSHGKMSTVAEKLPPGPTLFQKLPFKNMGQRFRPSLYFEMLP